MLQSAPRSMWARALKRFLFLGPLAVIGFVMICGYLLLSAFRAALTFTYWDRFEDTPDVLWLFPVGLRMDTILLSFALIIPAGLLLLLSKTVVSRVWRLIAGWMTGFMALLVYMEIATFPFVDEYDLRPDQKFLEYLGHVREVATTLLKVYFVELSIGAALLFLTALFFWKSARFLLAHYREWPMRTRLCCFPFVMGVMFLGARSTIGHRPANLSTACFSDNHLANEFALNSTYSMIYAGYRMLRHERNPSRDYGEMPRAEIFARVAARAGLSAVAADAPIPFLHRQTSPVERSRPMNVVVILQESMGASDVGCLTGPPITPNLCTLKDEGIWFSKLYATGTRTVRGIEAVVSGFLPTSAVGVLKLPRAKNNFFTAAALFKQHGYATDFMYGGMSNFDEMKSFFGGNGFQTIFDEPQFKNPSFHGTWGVSDEDLMRAANERYRAYGDRPFFSLLLTTSNHLPYEFPDGRIELYEQPKQTHWNAIKYADYALGLFFELAKKEAYYANTIFLVVADHNSHVRGNEHVPIEKFHIPGLIVGPGVPRSIVDKLASQIDLLPTLLHFTGLSTEHPLVGRNMMTLAPESPGRAFLQYGSNNAYWVDNRITILRPFLAPLHYLYNDKQLVETAADDEMARDALAHAHLPWILYSEGRYRLPQPNESAGPALP